VGPRRFELRKRVRAVIGTAVGAALICAGTALMFEGGTAGALGVLVAGLAGLLFLGELGVLVRELRDRDRYPEVVEVRSDGVAIDGRFIPFADIERLSHKVSSELVRTPVNEYASEDRWVYHWLVVIERRGDATDVIFQTSSKWYSPEDPVGAELVVALREAHGDLRA